MRVLVVGSGGREHAIVDALARSPQRPEVMCLPGNPGIAAQAELVAAGAGGTAEIVSVAERRGVDLVVVGPEAPLVEGLADALQGAGIDCFGPSQAAARLEGSKAFAKEVMAAAGVPTPAYVLAEDPAAALAAIERYPVVLKADGLAAGKGVVIAENEAAAKAALEALLVEHRFGTRQVLVEEHLEGPEVSLLAVCDGERAVPLASARDYKRIFDGDRGPNTGGMGSFSPVGAIGPEEAMDICARVHQPVVDEMAARGIPFHGILYAGIMLTERGAQVLEFNVRFGDPETQAILPRLESDLLAVMSAAVRPGGLVDVGLEWSERAAVTVVLASAGYPESSSSGDLIEGLDRLGPGAWVTHAGTALDPSGRLVTAGGRVLGVTYLGDHAAEARAGAYAAAEQIQFTGRQFRRDIASDAVADAALRSSP